MNLGALGIATLLCLYSTTLRADCDPSQNPLPESIQQTQKIALKAAGSLVQAGEVPCSKEERDSLDTPRSCCTQQMLNEVEGLRKVAIPAMEAAIASLSNPPKSALKQHFRMTTPDPASLGVLKARMTEMLESMKDPSTVRTYCRHSMDFTCSQGKRRAATENCSSIRPPRMWFCGAYGANPYFLGPGWLSTFIHEHAHAACKKVGDIFSDSHESYQFDLKRYPPKAEDTLKNPDSYAAYVMGFAKAR